MTCREAIMDLMRDGRSRSSVDIRMAVGTRWSWDTVRSTLYGLKERGDLRSDGSKCGQAAVYFKPASDNKEPAP